MRPERVLGIALVLIVVAAAAVGVWIALGSGTNAVPADGGTGPMLASPPAGEPARIERVIDGDTVVVDLDGRRERVRYIGVDAPELANAEAGIAAECWGQEARQANERLVDDAEVLLERDVSDRDRFGRLLRHVWVSEDGGWRLAAEELVAIGAVEARAYPPDTARDGELDRAERAARRDGRGLWGGC
ncbi:MAG TPA: thermonuclease family protein [Candidatus Limnocylindria bacterium]|nr:thermonuclease family protein [Candidatus Limnocylindria bacterium]